MGKVVNSYLMEFGYELLSALPHAYHLYCKGKLDGTVSGVDTKPLYFFSPNHKEINEKRAFRNVVAAKNMGIPNTAIHRSELDWDQFRAVPFKEHYKDKAITFDKPTVCICNRYTTEWGSEPINYFDIPTLSKMFDMLKYKYQIVYIRVTEDKYQDHEELKDLNEYETIFLDHPEVIPIETLINNDESYNEIQLRVFAGCERFITMNGGLGILASYFGGENIIYSKKGKELDARINSFNRWYYRLGGSFVTHVNNYEDLMSAIEKLFIHDDDKKVYVIYNTKDRNATRSKVNEITANIPFNRIVVFSASQATTKHIDGCKCIVDSSRIGRSNIDKPTESDTSKYSMGRDCVFINVGRGKNELVTALKTHPSKEESIYSTINIDDIYEKSWGNELISFITRKGSFMTYMDIKNKKY
jgi:hypothetical protein